MCCGYAENISSGLMMVVGTQHSLILGLEQRVDAYYKQLTRLVRFQLRAQLLLQQNGQHTSLIRMKWKFNSSQEYKMESKSHRVWDRLLSESSASALGDRYLCFPQKNLFPVLTKHLRNAGVEQYVRGRSGRTLDQKI